METKPLNKSIKYLLVAILFILGSFRMYSSADTGFQNDSEDLAIGPIYAEIAGIDIDTKSYGLGRLKSDAYEENVYYVRYLASVYGAEAYSDGYTYGVYSSQVGLQGIIYQFVAKFFSNYKIVIYGGKLACVVFFLIVISLITWQLSIKYGNLFAFVFFATTFLSNWVVNFASNLYWVEFTWYIPMLLGLLILNYESKKKFIYPFVYIAVLIKCLCGYEYLSTILMASILFLAVEWVCHKEKRKKLFTTMFIIGVISILAFVTAYLIHAYMYGDGSIAQGLKLMQVQLIERRTYGNAADFDSVLSASLNASVFTVLWKYFGFGNIGGVPMCMILILTVAALYYQSRILKKNCVFEISLFLISLFSTASWIVLAKSHSYIHTHINFGIFYLGWVQICFYIIVKMLLGTKRGNDFVKWVVIEK